MEELDIQLKNIQYKLHVLLKQSQLLIKQNAALQKENNILMASLNKKNDLINNLQQQIDVLKLNSSELDEVDKKQLEKRIEIYLADIEKCLALLNA